MGPRPPLAPFAVMALEGESEVMDQLRRAEIPQGRAASLLNVTLDELVERMERAGNPSFEMSKDELDMDDAVVLPSRLGRSG